MCLRVDGPNKRHTWIKIEHECFNFEKVTTIILGRSLYAFSPADQGLQVSRYDNLWDNSAICRVDAKKPLSAYTDVNGFALATIENRYIMMTGGVNDAKTRLVTTNLYDTIFFRWVTELH